MKKDKWKQAQSIVGTSLGRPKNDFYRTPEEATLALLEAERFHQEIIEPACGDGAISKVLEKAGHIVFSSDLYDYGYGKVGKDFLSGDWEGSEYFDLITNPPFKLAEKFLKRAMELRVRKFAYLLKLAFLEGQKRSYLLEKSPLKSVWVFRNRIQMMRENETPRSSGMIAFAWFVWEIGYVGKPTIGWISSKSK